MQKRRLTVKKMKRWHWFLVILFLTGLVLFSAGLYFIRQGGEPQFGFELAISGALAWGALLAIGMLYVARVYIKILRESRKF